jgi:glycine/D-amino acid oxidase-like deaminating enzyme
VVVGAGAIGLCTAFYLHQAGLPVHVVEQASVGAGSSWGNAGWVCLSHSAPVPAPGVLRDVARSIWRPDSPLYLRPQLSPSFLAWLVRFQRSCRRSVFERGYAAVATLASSTFTRFADLAGAGIDTTLTRPGLVHAFLSVEQGRRQLAVQRAATWSGYEVPDDVLTGADATALDPALDRAVQAAYLVAGEGVVDPTAFTTSLAGYLRRHGAPVSEHVTVRGFRRDGRRVTAVRTSGGDIDCSAVVVAAGVWSATLAGQLGVRLPLQAGKGYSFSVKLERPPEHPMHLGDRHVAVSQIGGVTRIAGTMELSGNNRNLDWRRVVAIAHASRRYLGRWYEHPDDLVALIHDPWVGGRPMFPDGLPALDLLPGVPNAYIATGHGMLGITLAPPSGQALAEYLVTGRRPAVLEPFRSDRFG